MIGDSFMSRANTIVMPGNKLDLAMQLILTPLILQLVERKRRDEGRRNRTNTTEARGGVLSDYALSEEQGNEIIMAARAHWFADEETADAGTSA
jgi:hypothetical protein